MKNPQLIPHLIKTDLFSEDMNKTRMSALITSVQNCTERSILGN